VEGTEEEETEELSGHMISLRINEDVHFPNWWKNSFILFY
jgi:hypothetical protein